tara:strand:+ start:1478 stop:1642 length:165 start_codon:yes stop_codon:yes gene_type:complete
MQYPTAWHVQGHCGDGVELGPAERIGNMHDKARQDFFKSSSKNAHATHLQARVP